MLPADGDLLVSSRVLHPTVPSGEMDGCHLWCDALVNAELHVAIVAIRLGRFMSTPVGRMQVNLAAQPACCACGVCFIMLLG